MFHKILHEQIKKFFGDESKIAPEYLPLLSEISETYESNESNRKLMVNRELKMIELKEELNQYKKNPSKIPFSAASLHRRGEH